MSPRFNTALINPATCPYFSQIILVHVLPSCCLRVHFSIIMSSTPVSAGYKIHITVRTTYSCPVVVWEINIASPIRYSAFIYFASVVLFAFTCTKKYELIKGYYYYWWWWWWWYNIDIQFPVELNKIGISISASISVRIEHRQ